MKNQTKSNLHDDTFPLQHIAASIERQTKILSDTKVECQVITELLTLSPGKRLFVKHLVKNFRFLHFLRSANVSFIPREQTRFKNIVDIIIAEFLLKTSFNDSFRESTAFTLNSKNLVINLKKIFDSTRQSISWKNKSLLNDRMLRFGELCDRVTNCVMASDEQFCPEKFYCLNKKPLFVEKYRVLDGQVDCSDGSDEIPIPRHQNSSTVKRNMIENWVLQIAVWIIALTSLIGNSIVILSTIFDLAKDRGFAGVFRKRTQSRSIKNSKIGLTKKSHPGSRGKIVKTCNSALVLNLAIADFFTGVYLICLAFVSKFFESSSGPKLNYWVSDKKWRTSRMCNFLGAALLTSSQASLITLVCLTSLRLFTVIKPFTIHRLKLKHAFIGCFITWIISFLIALIPIFPGLEEYFIQAAFVPFPHFQPPEINKTTAELLVQGISFLHNISLKSFESQSQLTWNQMSESIRTLSVEHSKWRFYGFYSEDSVCMPKLFINPEKDKFWRFSAALILFDLSFVVYITIAYFIIYFVSARGKKQIKFSMISCLCCYLSRLKSNSSTSTVTKDVRKNKLLTVFNQSHKNINLKRHIAKKRTGPLQQGNEIQRRIALLVITDCICWVPVCFMSLFFLFGFAIPDGAYVITAVLLLPINSAINPLLYSSFLRAVWVKLWKFYKIQTTN